MERPAYYQRRWKQDEEELRILNLLRNFLADTNDTQELRIAGGWVRDRIWGLPSSADVDIAIESPSGVDLAERFKEYLSEKRISTAEVVTIKRNPEKSKHLETAQLNFTGPEWNGLSIDFVNLRSESYAENSRIPTVKVGTPKEDALRRDFTINSLFYNITRDCVEDYIGGMEDLEKYRLRTCLPGEQTFLDDPLRIVRAARFLATYPRLTLENDSQFANCLERSRQALSVKVSPERIVGEMEKLAAKKPKELFHMLKHLGLWDMLQVIFPAYPKETSKYTLDRQNEGWRQGLGLIWTMYDLFDIHEATVKECKEVQTKSIEIRALVYYLSALLYPLTGNRVTPPHISCVERALKEAKMKGFVQKGVVTAQTRGSHLFSTWNINDRLPVGRNLLDPLLREWWPTSVCLACCLKLQLEVPTQYGKKPENMKVMTDEEGRALSEKSFTEIMQKLKRLDLIGVWDTKSDINGQQLKKILPRLSSGPQFGMVMQQVLENKVAHPEWSIEAQRRFLRSSYPEYR